MIEIRIARAVPLLHHPLDMVVRYRHHRNIRNRITCSTTVVAEVVTTTRAMAAPFLHHPHHLLPVTVVVVEVDTTMLTIMAGQLPTTTTGIHTITIGEEEIDMIGVGVIGTSTITMVVIVIECILVRHIRRRDRFEPEIESETVPAVDCCTTRIRRSIIIIIGGIETKTVMDNISILVWLLEVEIEAGVEGAVVGAGVTAEMGDGVDERARIAENEIIEDPAGGVEEMTFMETTRDTRASRDPKSLDLADGIAMKIT
jgi:hypothetical protein